MHTLIPTLSLSLGVLFSSAVNGIIIFLVKFSKFSYKYIYIQYMHGLIIMIKRKKNECPISPEFSQLFMTNYSLIKLN